MGEVFLLPKLPSPYPEETHETKHRDPTNEGPRKRLGVSLVVLTDPSESN